MTPNVWTLSAAVTLGQIWSSMSFPTLKINNANDIEWKVESGKLKVYSGNSIIEAKALAFAKRIVDLYRYLKHSKHEYILSQQIFRSGTSIGANVIEGEDGESRADFRHKMNVALKETSETIYWLKLLRYGNYISENGFYSLYQDANEIRRILVAIIKNSKSEELKDDEGQGKAEG
jgi:four helix bundle protein